MVDAKKRIRRREDGGDNEIDDDVIARIYWPANHSQRKQCSLR